MKVTTLGIDLAKSIFQLHGLDQRGHVAVQKRVLTDPERTHQQVEGGKKFALEKRQEKGCQRVAVLSALPLPGMLAFFPGPESAVIRRR